MPDAVPPTLPDDLALPIGGGAVDARDVVLTTPEGDRLRAFAARAAKPARKGVVIFPDWRGLGHFYEELAMRFADAGYEAIAFDYFGRTAGTDPHPADFDQMQHVGATSAETVATDAAAAASYLRSQEGGEVRGLAALGFCFGGRHALLQALPEASTRPAAVVSFYGQPGPDRSGRPGPIAVAPGFSRPVLGLYGGADQSIPVAQVEQLDAALAGAGVPHEIHVYPRATHSFFDRRSDEFAEEADDAWHRVIAFLERSLTLPAAD